MVVYVLFKRSATAGCDTYGQTLALHDALPVLVAGNSYLERVPGVTIPHGSARYDARTDITVDPTATLLFSEIVMSGRKYHDGGEMFVYDLYSTMIKAERPDGKNLFTEKLVIEPARFPVRYGGIMGDHAVFGNVIQIGRASCRERVCQYV